MVPRKNRSLVVPLFLVGVVGMLASACAPDPDPGTIMVEWKLGFGVACDHPEADVDKIRVTLLEPGEAEVAVVTREYPDGFSKTFSCSAGEATLDRVPLGTFNLLIEAGKGDFDYAVFKARVGGLVVEEGALLDVGEVSMEKLPPSANPGGLEVSWTFDAGLCGANDVDTVQLVVWRERVFREHDKNYPCDLPSPGHVKLDLAPGTYAITAEGLNLEAMVTRRGEADDVEIAEGTTTSLVGSDAIVLQP